MKCKEINKKLLFYQLGELPERDRHEIEEHLKGCSDCASALSKMNSIMSMIDEEKKLEPSPFLFSKIENKINNLRTENVKENAMPVFAWHLRHVFITVSIVTGIIAGVITGNYLNIITNTGETFSKTSNITSNSTKGFYLYGVDDEAI